MSLELSTWGRVDINEEHEMIPKGYFEGHVDAKRRCDDVKAITIWPCSWQWKTVVVNGHSKTKKMCEYLINAYNDGDNAFALVEKVGGTSSPGVRCERSHICTLMTSVLCETILGSSEEMTLEICKNLVKIIGTHCPSFVPKFTASVKQLEDRSIIYPLVTESALSSAVNDSMKESLSLLTNYCAQILDLRARSGRYQMLRKTVTSFQASSGARV